MNIPRYLFFTLFCLVLLLPDRGESGDRVLLDGNLRCVDLSDLTEALPLTVTRSKQILRRTEQWEHSSWDGKNDPDSVGYPSVVKNDRGRNPDGKYYLYFAHHDPCSGIGCAIADSIEGPYRKLAELDTNRKQSMVLANPHYPARRGDPAHYSSPCVLWNEEENLWFMYFHYWNHYHDVWEKNPHFPGAGHQMTALATSPDLGLHQWTVVKETSYRKVSIHDILPVLPTTRKPWMCSGSSYHAIQRLPDGQWLAFLRGTGIDNLPKLGFARSDDGRKWKYFPENPVIHQNDESKGQKGIYRPFFVGYLGKDQMKQHQYLLVWGESPKSPDIPKVMYGYTTDFVHVKRDPRGYAKWTGGDGLISPWREKNKLYLFAGKQVHVIILPVSSRE